MEACLIYREIVKAPIILALVLAVASCSAEREKDCGDVTAQQYQVLSTILNNEYVESGQTIVIYERSVPLDNFDFSEDRLRRYDLPDSLIRSFVDSNAVPSQFEQRFELAVPYKLMTEEQFASINAVYLERFDRFREAFPEAHSLSGTRTIRFTLPGFSSDFTKSAVLVEYWNSRKSIYFLSRKECTWAIDGEIPFAYH